MRFEELMVELSGILSLLSSLLSLILFFFSDKAIYMKKSIKSAFKRLALFGALSMLSFGLASFVGTTFFVKMTFIGGFFAVSILDLLLSFRYEELPFYRKLILGLYLVSAVFFILAQFDLVMKVKETESVLPQINPGKLDVAFRLFLSLVFALFMVFGICFLRDSEGEEKLKVSYIFWNSIALLLVMILFVVLPVILFSYYYLIPVVGPFSYLFILMNFYSLKKFGAEKFEFSWLVWVFYLVFYGVVPFVVFLVLSPVFKEVVSEQSALVSAFYMLWVYILTSVYFYLVPKFMNLMLIPALRGRVADYVMSYFSDITVLTRGSIVENTVKGMVKLFDASFCAVFLKGEDGKWKIEASAGAVPGLKRAFRSDEVQFLELFELLGEDYLDRGSVKVLPAGKDGSKSIESVFNELMAKIILRIAVGSETVGFIVIGPKKTGRDYTVSDVSAMLEALKIVSILIYYEVKSRKILEFERAVKIMNMEVEVARRVQKSILPERLSVDGIEVAGEVIAASGGLSSKIYDFLWLPENNSIGFLVVDVRERSISGLMKMFLVRIISRIVMRLFYGGGGSFESVAKEIVKLSKEHLPEEQTIDYAYGVVDLKMIKVFFKRQGKFKVLVLKKGGFWEPDGEELLMEPQTAFSIIGGLSRIDEESAKSIYLYSKGKHSPADLFGGISQFVEEDAVVLTIYNP